MKSKKNLTDRVSANTSKKRLNPFEVHVNKKKFDVLGKKSKTEKGLPGISRSRALKKRKATLLQEYKLKSKNNKFFDRRIGERDTAMTAEDKILARYTAERMKVHSKKSLYNLGDNEILTHRGSRLADIEKFEDPRSEDEDDNDDERNKSGKLDEDFVSDAHFGGGMLKKSGGDVKSRKDIIDQLIADSKKRKAEKQKLREQTLDLTEKLDEEWKNLSSVISSSKSNLEPERELKSDKRYASFDKLSKELKFEARGKATDKLKTDEAIAREEKEKLEKLEAERVKRMLGDLSVPKTIKHRSADDLDDGFDINETEVPKKKKKADESENEEEMDLPVTQNDSGSESESSVDEEELNGDEHDQKGDSVDGGGGPGNSGEEPQEDSGEESENDNEQDDSESDDLSDLKDSEDSEGEEDIPLPSKTRKKTEAPLKKPLSELERSLKDLPFTLRIPEEYDEFEQLLADQSAEYQAVAVERMVRSNHPSLKDGSRQKLILLFKYLLQHFQDLATNPTTQGNSFVILDKLSPWLFDLAQFAPEDAMNSMCELIKEKYEEFIRRPRRFPDLDTVIFFKVVSLLFPASDFRHRLITPTMTFMQNTLASCRVKSSTDVAMGLFISTLVLEYTSLSKRFVPEAINFIRGVLRSAQPFVSSSPHIPPFSAKSYYPLRVVSSALLESDLKPLSTLDLVVEDDSDDFKVRAISLSLKLLLQFLECFEEPSAYLIFEPFVPLLDGANICQCLRKQVESALERIQGLQRKKLYKLVAEKKRPKPLKLYEPSIEDVYVFKKRPGLSKEKEEHQKLLYKYKKEVKGALREIRRDNSFLAKIKFNETKASDIERQKKVKEIFGDAAQQAGEIRKMKRSK